MQKSLLIAFLFLFHFSFIFSQDIEKNIRSIEDDFKNFKYQQVIEKGKFLLADAYTTHDDSLLIYQYMLSSAYAKGDTSFAGEIITNILRSDPKFSLNPKNTSPKIIELFEYIKRKHQAASAEELRAKKLKEKPALNYPPPLHPGLSVASILLPGSAHYLNGSVKKGLIYTSISLLGITASIYSIYLTADKRDAYLSADRSANFDKLYNSYNSAYKTRNFLLIGYALWNIYCLYDLHKEHSVNYNISIKKDALSLNIIKVW